MAGVFRRAGAGRSRTGVRPSDLWLDKALIALDLASKSPCTLRFYRTDGDGKQSADSAVDAVLPFLQEAGHTVVNVSGGGSSPVAYLTVVPKHLAAAQPLEPRRPVAPVASVESLIPGQT